MVTLDRIRLTGLLTEKPWKRGFSYCVGNPWIRHGTGEAVSGGLSPQSSEISRSQGTTRFAFSSNSASSARCLGAPRASGSPPAYTSSGPSSPNSSPASTARSYLGAGRGAESCDRCDVALRLVETDRLCDGGLRFCFLTAGALHLGESEPGRARWLRKSPVSPNATACWASARASASWPSWESASRASPARRKITVEKGPGGRERPYARHSSASSQRPSSE